MKSSLMKRYLRTVSKSLKSKFKTKLAGQRFEVSIKRRLSLTIRYSHSGLEKPVEQDCRK